MPVHAEMQQAKSIPFPLRTPVPRFSSPGPRGRSHGDRLQELRPFSIWVPQSIDLRDKSRSQPTLRFGEKTIEHSIAVGKIQGHGSSFDPIEEHGNQERRAMKTATPPQGTVQADTRPCSSDIEDSEEQSEEENSKGDDEEADIIPLSPQPPSGSQPRPSRANTALFLFDEAPPRGFKKLHCRVDAQMNPLPSEYIPGDGFAKGESYPTGRVGVLGASSQLKRKKQSSTTTGFGVLDFCQASQPTSAANDFSETKKRRKKGEEDNSFLRSPRRPQPSHRIPQEPSTSQSIKCSSSPLALSSDILRKRSTAESLRIESNMTVHHKKPTCDVPLGTAGGVPQSSQSPSLGFHRHSREEKQGATNDCESRRIHHGIHLKAHDQSQDGPAVEPTVELVLDNTSSGVIVEQSSPVDSHRTPREIAPQSTWETFVSETPTSYSRRSFPPSSLATEVTTSKAQLRRCKTG